MTGISISPLWLIRAFAITALVPLVLAMLVWTSGIRHNFCIGLTVGLLIGLIVQTFADQNAAPR
jgi:preprotein translocase subunit SecF